MLESALGGEQHPFGVKVVEHRTRSLAYRFRRFYCIAALVNDADRKLAAEFPLVPEPEHVVAERTILQRRLVDLHQPEALCQVVVVGEVDTFAPRIAAAHVKADLDVQPFNSSVQNLRGPDDLFGKGGPGRLIELDELTSGTDYLL